MGQLGPAHLLNIKQKKGMRMSTREIVVESGDSVLVVKDDGTWVTYFQEPVGGAADWTTGQLVMSGLHWSLMNEAWYDKLIKRAYEKARQLSNELRGG